MTRPYVGARVRCVRPWTFEWEDDEGDYSVEFPAGTVGRVSGVSGVGRATSAIVEVPGVDLPDPDMLAREFGPGGHWVVEDDEQ